MTVTEHKEHIHKIIYRLAEQGLTQKDIALATGYTQAGISHTLAKIKSANGVENYQVGKPSGRPAKLKRHQRQELKRLLAKGAKANGFPSDGWTRMRIQSFINVRFQVDYSLPHISRLMTTLGYSLKQPQVKDTRQRSEQIAYYETEVIPELKKN